MDWKIEFSRNVIKDAKKLKSVNLESNLKSLLEILKQNPYEPPYEKLSGNLKGYCSRRINIKHRLVYSVNEETKTVRVISVWSHYEQQEIREDRFVIQIRGDRLCGRSVDALGDRFTNVHEFPLFFCDNLDLDILIKEKLN